MFHIIQDVFTLKAIWGFIMSTSHEFLQGRLVAAWSDESAWDSFMDKHSVVSYIVESTVMDVFDDMKEYGINPWYHPVASFKQVMYPLVRFFWEIFGKSPVFWLIVAVWVIRRAHSNYNECCYRYLARGRSALSRWWRNAYLVSRNGNAPTPAESTEGPQNNDPAPAENAENPPNDDFALALAENTRALAENARALAENAQLLAENPSNDENTPAPTENAPAPAPAENAPPADNAPALADNAPPADNTPALADSAPSADNDPTPNGNAPATAAENTPLAENTLIPNGDAPAANGKA